MDRYAFLKDLKKHGQENDIPNISEESACFLRSLLEEIQVKNMLEIGTANGYSTIQFADILEKIWGHITTIEFSENSYKKAQENFEMTEISHCITQHLGNALDIIPKLEEMYDFVFIDGMKRRSLDFLKLVWKKVPIWGTIVIDDVIKFRHKMVGLYEYIESEQIDHSVIQIDEDDGIMIIKKREA